MKQILLAALFFGLSVTTFAGDNEPIYKTAPMKIRERQKKTARPDIPGNLMFEFGLNILQDNPPPMETAVFGSRTANFYYTYELQFGKSGFFFVPGLGLGLDRYKFDGDYTLQQNSDGSVVFSDISELSPKKSHIIANYFDIPLELRFYVNQNDRRRSFFVSFGGKFGVLFASHTKIKYDDGVEMIKVKDKRTFGLNRFRYGLTGRMGFGGFSAFGYFSLSELFETGPVGTLDTANILVGISLNLF